VERCLFSLVFLSSPKTNQARNQRLSTHACVARRVYSLWLLLPAAIVTGGYCYRRPLLTAAIVDGGHCYRRPLATYSWLSQGVQKQFPLIIRGNEKRDQKPNRTGDVGGGRSTARPTSKHPQPQKIESW
jgi:hypothetical protein